MFAEMIDKIVSLKETKIFEIDGQTYSDANLTRIPPHVDLQAGAHRNRKGWDDHHGTCPGL